MPTKVEIICVCDHSTISRETWSNFICLQKTNILTHFQEIFYLRNLDIDLSRYKDGFCSKIKINTYSSVLHSHTVLMKL